MKVIQITPSIEFIFSTDAFNHWRDSTIKVEEESPDVPFEVSLLRADEFVKFYDFNEKLLIHTIYIIGCVKNITNTYLWLLLVKLYISPVLSF